jgi:hypothetical protein
LTLSVGPRETLIPVGVLNLDLYEIFSFDKVSFSSKDEFHQMFSLSYLPRICISRITETNVRARLKALLAATAY